MGIAARHIMCLAQAVWYNLKLTRNGEAQLEAELTAAKQARRAANKTQPTNNTPQQQPDTDQPASSPPTGEAPDFRARPPP